MSKERTCLICGKKYEFCPHCSGTNKEPSWKYLYCSENCNGIDNVIASYKAKKIDVGQAKIMLNRFALPSLENVNEYAKPYLSEIIGYTSNVESVSEPVVEALNEVPLENVLPASEIEEVLEPTEEVTEELVQAEQEAEQIDEVVEDTTTHKSRKHK